MNWSATAAPPLAGEHPVAEGKQRFAAVRIGGLVLHGGDAVSDAWVVEELENFVWSDAGDRRDTAP